MTEQPLAHEATIWTDPTRTSLIGRVLQLMAPAVRPIAVGGPRGAQLDTLAQKLGCPRYDDLRKMVVDHPASFLLLSSSALLRFEDILAAVNEGSDVLALEPIAGDFDELNVPQSTAMKSGQVVCIPAFAASPGWMGAAEPADVLGQSQVISYRSFGQIGECSLLARLFDAFVFLQQLAPMPESIDASLITPLAGLPQQLRGMTGHLLAHLRFAGDRAGVLHVSDQAGLGGRSLFVQGERAELHIGDHEYELRDLDGKIIDRMEAEGTDSTGFADLIAWQWHQFLRQRERRFDRDGQQINTRALVCCLSCLLSSRTGQPESPIKLLSMHGQT